MAKATPTTSPTGTAADDAAQLQSLLEGIARGRTTAAARKSAARKMIEGFDLDQLLTLQERMRQFVDVATANSVALDDSELIPAEKAERLMAETLALRDIVEFLDVRKSMIREAVFAHITATLRIEGDFDPEYANGALEVPSLAKKFTREGGGSTPLIDHDKLRKALGDRADQVFDEEVIPEQVIPAQVVHQLNSGRLLELLRDDPSVMELVRDSLTTTPRRSPRFQVRDL